MTAETAILEDVRRRRRNRIIERVFFAALAAGCATFSGCSSLPGLAFPGGPSPFLPAGAPAGNMPLTPAPASAASPLPTPGTATRGANAPPRTLRPRGEVGDFGADMHICAARAG